jgi:hypothetical protein
VRIWQDESALTPHHELVAAAGVRTIESEPAQPVHEFPSRYRCKPCHLADDLLRYPNGNPLQGRNWQSLGNAEKQPILYGIGQVLTALLDGLPGSPYAVQSRDFGVDRLRVFY